LFFLRIGKTSCTIVRRVANPQTAYRFDISRESFAYEEKLIIDPINLSLEKVSKVFQQIKKEKKRRFFHHLIEMFPKSRQDQEVTKSKKVKMIFWRHKSQDVKIMIFDFLQKFNCLLTLRMKIKSFWFFVNSCVFLGMENDDGPRESASRAFKSPFASPRLSPLTLYYLLSRESIPPIGKQGETLLGNLPLVPW